MNTYQYKARDRFGKAINGTIEAASEELVALKLKEAGYAPVSIKKAPEKGTVIKLFDKFKGVGLSEVNMFSRQFFSLQRAGLPILSSLDGLRDQAENKIFKEAIGQIGRDIEGGMDLSSALARYPKIFNEIYVSMVKIGETAGILDDTLERLAVLGENEERIRSQIKSATRYPVIVVCAIAIGFIILTTLVVPRFARLYSHFTTALPIPTQILIWINYAITKFWWLTTIILSILSFGFYRFINTERGRRWWDNLKLKVPVFGPLILKLNMSRFARVTGILMKSGVPILRILELASSGAGNVIISRTLDNIRISVSEGKGMVEPMKFSGMFPPVVTQMVSVGEETGKIDELLMYVADYYDAQANYTIGNLTTLIEPILIVILGSGVLLMALGIFLPMWNMMRFFIVK